MRLSNNVLTTHQHFSIFIDFIDLITYKIQTNTFIIKVKVKLLDKDLMRQ